jgi:hypothetical protein
VLESSFPGITLYLAACVPAKDRTVLTALWKAHRTRFISGMQLDAAGAAAALLGTLADAQPGQLVAAQVVTDRADYLVWIDVARRQVVATFANGGALMAGL